MLSAMHRMHELSYCSWHASFEPWTLCPLCCTWPSMLVIFIILQTRRLRVWPPMKMHISGNPAGVDARTIRDCLQADAVACVQVHLLYRDLEEQYYQKEQHRRRLAEAGIAAQADGRLQPTFCLGVEGQVPPDGSGGSNFQDIFTTSSSSSGHLGVGE